MATNMVIINSSSHHCLIATRRSSSPSYKEVSSKFMKGDNNQINMLQCGLELQSKPYVYFHHPVFRTYHSFQNIHLQVGTSEGSSFNTTKQAQSRQLQQPNSSFLPHCLPGLHHSIINPRLELE